MNFMGVNEEELKARISAEAFAEFQEFFEKSLKEALEMECPICGSKLILGTGTKKYETLSDHVCDPNNDVPDRPYFVCPNDRCKLHGNSFWDDYGEYYTDLDYAVMREVFGLTIEECYKDSNPKSCKAAMNSNARKAWFEISYKEESKRFFIGKLGFYFYNGFKADKRS